MKKKERNIWTNLHPEESNWGQQVNCTFQILQSIWIWGWEIFLKHTAHYKLQLYHWGVFHSTHSVTGTSRHTWWNVVPLMNLSEVVFCNMVLILVWPTVSRDMASNQISILARGHGIYIQSQTVKTPSSDLHVCASLPRAAHWDQHKILIEKFIMFCYIWLNEMWQLNTEGHLAVSSNMCLLSSFWHKRATFRALRTSWATCFQSDSMVLA